jgi:uncharacterized protein DUF5655
MELPPTKSEQPYRSGFLRLFWVRCVLDFPQMHGTPTEADLTRELSEDLKDAWERLRETATEFGPQRIYASHNSIMFSRKICYFFVRPKKKYLEVWFFLGRKLENPLIRQTMPASKRKIAHHVRIIHRDQVESPITDWLREAYDVSEAIRTPAKVKFKKR